MSKINNKKDNIDESELENNSDIVSNSDEDEDVDIDDNIDNDIDESDLDENNFLNEDDDQSTLNDSDLSETELSSEDQPDLSDSYENCLSDITISEAQLISDRISKPIITKFEFNRILGERLCQISKDAPLLIKISNKKDIVNNVKEEIRQKKTPFKIKRKFPNNKYEIWSLSELEIPDIYFLENT